MTAAVPELLLLLLVLPGWVLMAKAENLIEPLIQWIHGQGGQVSLKPLACVLPRPAPLSHTTTIAVLHLSLCLLSLNCLLLLVILIFRLL
jgi:hypothetical protein